MAFDVSKITSAVNSYLYSISDVNKLLNGEEESSSSTLSGIFQKYLNKAISDEDAADKSETDENVTKALSALSGLNSSETTGSNSDDLFADNSLIISAFANEAAQKAVSSQSKPTFESLDIAGEIERNMASHNRLDEIQSYNNYNASRISAYAAKASDKSVFGDFKL